MAPEPDSTEKMESLLGVLGALGLNLGMGLDLGLNLDLAPPYQEDQLLVGVHYQYKLGELQGARFHQDRVACGSRRCQRRNTPQCNPKTIGNWTEL